LLHRNLVDVREGLSSRCAFNRLQRDFLHSLLGLIELLLQRNDLRRLARDRFLLSPDSKIGYVCVGLAIFSEHQKLLVELQLRRFSSLRRCLLGFASQPRERFFPLLELQFTTAPIFLERLLPFFAFRGALGGDFRILALLLRTIILH
jgi:hypothetical protein